jgi:polyketide synthase 12
LLARVTADPAADIAAVGSLLATAARAPLEYRAVVLGGTRDALLAGVGALAGEREAPNLFTGRAVGGDRVAFLFPGQGTQWQHMAVDLLASAPVFADTIRACERALHPFVDWSLEGVLLAADGAPELDRVDVVQPVLFAMMVSLAQLWRAFGVRPDAVVGHSQGELAAAYVAGALSLDDAVRVVALRSKALAAIRGRGTMVTVLAPNDQVHRMLETRRDRLSVAAINGPAAITVSGDVDAVAEFEAALSAARMLRWRLPGVDFAAHSPHVTDIRAELLAIASDVRPRTCDTAFYSTVAGAAVDTGGLDGDYWYRNLRQTVRFDAAARAMVADGYAMFVECSTQPVLTVGLQDIAEQDGASVAIMATLRREEGGLDRFVAALAEAYVRGVPVDWAPLLG